MIHTIILSDNWSKIRSEKVKHFHSGFEHESVQKKISKTMCALVEVQKECRIRTRYQRWLKLSDLQNSRFLAHHHSILEHF